VTRHKALTPRRCAKATAIDWAGDPLPFSPEGLGRPEDGQDEVALGLGRIIALCYR
jgi:hypothetical protein